MGTARPDTTISRSAAPRERSRGGPALFVVIHADAPAASGARILLRGVDRVIIGRGPTRTTSRLSDDLLRIDLPDGRVSVEHARLERALGQWTVFDAGSKNGLFVDGQRLERHVLRDGDWIEVGHTFLRYRESIAAVRDVDAADGSTSRLRTLLPAVQTEVDKLCQVADKHVPVLIGGETGSGKEVMARSLHELSHRSGPFVVINCGAIPAALVEATLFGHRRGAFSGAVEDRPGVVASADGGTLLLDEIGDLPLPQQAALLRVVQEKEVVPVGETRPRKVDVRFVCATHRDLDALVRQERFRADLLARLAGVRIAIPPLRERIEDLGILVAGILAEARAPRCQLARDAAWALCRHRWPSNTRELEQALTGALALSPAGKIALPELPEALRNLPEVDSDRDGARRDELVACLLEHHGNLAAVARALGTSRTQIHRLLERYGIDPRAHR
jgi:DNA-binding NtrC family response regulator